MEATGSSIRYRANVTRNSKGYSVDWTVERTFSEAEMRGADDSKEGLAYLERATLDALKSFGAKLEAAYPATAEAAKPEKVAATGAS